MYPNFRNGSYQWYQSRRFSAAGYGGEIEEMNEEIENQQLQNDMAKLRRMLENSKDQFRKGMEEMRLLFVEKFGLHSGSSGLHHIGSPQPADEEKNVKKMESADEEKNVKKIDSAEEIEMNTDIVEKKIEYEDEESIEEIPKNSLSHFAGEFSLKSFRKFSNEKSDLSTRSLSEEVAIDELKTINGHSQMQCHEMVAKDDVIHVFDKIPQPMLIEKNSTWHASKVFDEMPNKKLVECCDVLGSYLADNDEGKKLRHDESYASYDDEYLVKKPRIGNQLGFQLQNINTAVYSSAERGEKQVSDEKNTHAAILDHVGFPEAFAEVHDLNVWYGLVIYMKINIMELLQQVPVMCDEEMEANTTVGMKWHLSVEKQRYMPLPPPEPPPPRYQ